ncbi:subtilisin-like protease SDD1 [Carex littledalei]|uniref:Subtilisin-like protease SDD1 n=1 Tax=Carex littledalei TaxID=544730 RepID=A0A833VXP7_9POAL|nr:subtilisin-like protease SDD1 [Carex littledalei]
MDSKRSSLLLSLYIPILIFSLATIAVSNNDGNKLQNYMVFVRPASHITSSSETWHNSLLFSVCKVSGPSRLIYSFSTVVNGFAARLTEEEVQVMSKQPWFLRAVLANNRYKLMTTQTPNFLKLSGSHGLWKKTKNEGEGVIIGLIDTGVSPGHPSFDDSGMPAPPAKWKGHCDFNATFCNNKLIGAKSFLKAGAEAQNHIAPVDDIGHGTHTASTAAGAFVGNTSLFGMPMGLASGVAPRAHIAAYQVCASYGCQEVDILKGIEEAVKDGCDVISLSLGSKSRPFYNDSLAIGTFAAIVKGIFVSTAAGNYGPEPYSLSNEAPWLLTVAATTINRRFVSTVKLGNGHRFDGESLYQPKNWTAKEFPIVYFGKKNGSDLAGLCMDLDEKQVRGKIVICDRGQSARLEKGLAVQKAGGVGMILVNYKEDKFETIPDAHFLPASDVTYSYGQKIKKYLRKTKNPVATFIFRGVVLDDKWSPSVAPFSSRGPSLQGALVLKPDVAGPGVNIFAAVPPLVDQVETMQFFIMSGTSMACPHLSGIAALIKHAHPNWSPAAIKSAIMTTAYVKALNGKQITNEHYIPANVFEMGAGHVDPKKALNPGLVYDITPEEYIWYLCGLGYNDDQIETIIHPVPRVKCAEIKAIPQEQLNLPSIGVPSSNGTVVIYRTVTNVGKAPATYTALINVPRGVSATVEPAVLHFSRVNESKKFKIEFKWDGIIDTNNTFGDLKWVSAGHVVRSTIALQIDIPIVD